MKKVFLTLALVAFAFAANAQWVIGGQIGYWTNGANEKTTNVTGATTTEFTLPGDNFANVNTSTLNILPSVGYQLNDKMLVGAYFGLGWNKEVDYSNWLVEYATIKDFEGWTRTTQMNIVIAPYFRYNLMEFGNFKLFCEAELGFTFGLNPTIHNHNIAHTDPIMGTPVAAVDENVKGIKATSTDITFRIVPGLNYKFSDNFSADLYLNVAALAYNFHREKTFTDWNVVNDMPAGSPVWTSENIYTTNDFNFEVDMFENYNLNNLFTIGFNYHF